MRSYFTVVLDANVFYPAPLRDFLLELATSGVYRARWTDEITDEWVRNLLRKRNDLTQARIDYTVEKMSEAVPGSLVTEYESIIAGLVLPDKNDRHVLAAAIKCSAQVIVTYNLKDFPASVLTPYGIEAKHPDEFLQDCYDLASSQVIGAVKSILSRLKNPPKSAQELIEIYRNQGLALTAASLEDVVHLLE